MPRPHEPSNAVRCPDDGTVIPENLQGAVKLQHRKDELRMLSILCPKCDRHYTREQAFDAQRQRWIDTGDWMSLDRRISLMDLAIQHANTLTKSA